mmetsp:Transcript_39294/g.78511  ORF Transcript_39294/g.78511 Transcript_39294/m.78511 type:complete len:269 (+) Transcript_39294:851-1657(+)
MAADIKGGPHQPLDVVLAVVHHLGVPVGDVDALELRLQNFDGTENKAAPAAEIDNQLREICTVSCDRRPLCGVSDPIGEPRRDSEPDDLGNKALYLHRRCAFLLNELVIRPTKSGKRCGRATYKAFLARLRDRPWLVERVYVARQTGRLRFRRIWTRTLGTDEQIPSFRALRCHRGACRCVLECPIPAPSRANVDVVLFKVVCGGRYALVYCLSLLAAQDVIVPTRHNIDAIAHILLDESEKCLLRAIRLRIRRCRALAALWAGDVSS